MNDRSGFWMLCLVLLAGCAAPVRNPAPEVIAPPPAVDGPSQSTLASRSPEPDVSELFHYQRYWCARDPAARQQRRELLNPGTDRLELLLLRYCTEARTRPHRLVDELHQLEQTRAWPAGYDDYFAWLEWHLQAFTAAGAEAEAERRRMQTKIRQLRAIEDEVNSRNSVPVTTQ
jgi:hypothetical protein